YAKQLINQTIEVYDGYYLYLLTRIENIVGIDTETGDTLKSNIENEKTWLQTQRVNIVEADSVEETEAVATNLNNYFAEKKPLLKKVIGIITSSRVNKSLISLTDVKTRTANHIANLTELDKDTKTVASILTEYTEKLNQVNEKYILARDGFLSLSSTDTVDQDYTTHLNTLKEAKDLLLEADILRANIVTELIKIKASTVGGAGDLSATGEGSVLMSGELTTTVTSEQNTAVVVYDLAGDLAVESVGETAIESVGRKVTYSNFTQATITGTDYVILVTGTITEVTATGTGRAYLTGTGTYQNATGTSQSFDATNGVVYNIITS
ncbi:hypothetical protein KJ782_06575, partial [Patescibacteria group bacterium]|nr:hypothetical protein [Patescibacteria group bacterium]